jgi:hypothetical protein
MDTAPFHELWEEDRKLTVGALVTARWTNQGYLCRARGQIVHRGPRSVTVKLVEQEAGHSAASKGTTLTLPRFCDQQAWSLDNCVRLDRGPRRRSLHLPPGSLRG